MRLGFLAILLALVGCADDYASVFITGVSTPTASDGACTYDPSTQLLSGRYDYSAGTSYELALSVENSLFARENGLHAETNGVFVTDAVVNMISTATSRANAPTRRLQTRRRAQMIDLASSMWIFSFRRKRPE